MKSIIRLEEGLMLALSIVLTQDLPYPGWLYWVLFLAPDVGFVGYIVNPRTGAFTYNVLHHKGLAILLYLAGLYFNEQSLQFAGLLLFGHSAFDRMLGYGLKYNDSFHHTHLGWIGAGKTD